MTVWMGQRGHALAFLEYGVLQRVQLEVFRVYILTAVRGRLQASTLHSNRKEIKVVE